tara:strand:- start:1683 stop:2582 length:900 start_codon:yes stop_codon:yes gene_type:complete
MSKDNYVIFNPEGGLGKIIASTAVLKFIQKKYPEHKIIVITPWAEMFLNNPRVHRVYKTGNHPYFYKDYIEGRESILLKGEPYFNSKHMYQKQHLIQSWCELHDLEFDGNVKPELYFTKPELEYYAANIGDDGRPILAMQTNGGMFENDKQYCWTRDIPHNQAQILVNELSKVYRILHVTRPNCPVLENTERVDSIPNKRTFIAMLLRSQKRLLIDSCLQHAAAAFDLPSTVCWVGTSPDTFGYDMHTNITPTKEKQNVASGMIDSLFFDNDFNGPEYEYPYEDFDIFNLQTIFNSLTQ